MEDDFSRHPWVIYIHLDTLSWVKSIHYHKFNINSLFCIILNICCKFNLLKDIFLFGTPFALLCFNK